MRKPKQGVTNDGTGTLLGKRQPSAWRVMLELTKVEAELINSKWLVGSQISAADIALFRLMQTLLRVASKEVAKPFKLGFLPLVAYPHIAAWMKQVEAIPGTIRRTLHIGRITNQAKPVLSGR